MKEYIIELKDITDTKEFVEAKVPKFVVGFIYMITGFIFALLLWMWFSEVDIVVKATGIVRPDKKVSTIININGGNVKILNFFDGKIVKKGELLYEVDITSFVLQKEVLLSSREKLGNDIKNLRILEKSVSSESNYFTQGDVEFYNRYIFYELKQEQLRMDYEQINNRYKQEKELGSSFTTKNSLDEYKAKLDLIKNSLDKNRSEMLFSVKSELLTKEEELIKNINQLKEMEKSIELNRVLAPIDGMLQVVKDYNVGDYINPSVEVLKIIPKDAKLKMEIAVNNKDISHIKKGGKAKFRFLAFPYKEYGIVEGDVKNISGDITVDNQNNSMTYKVEAEIPTKKIISRDGKEGLIKVGMLSEVRVVTRRKKIFHIVLEKLDFMKEM